MVIAAGTRLGPYEILTPLGSGGMGEVYKARDPRIGREVAVKILPSEYCNDPDRLRRFELEARAAGMLNHPNILAILDVGTGSHSPYLVSELLDGETLRDKIRLGPIPGRKAMDYAIQLSHGLAAAHERNIVHRDLKPENIFVTKDGRIKILDFGLAKLVLPEAGNGEASQLETGVVESKPGIVLGTVGYMSPEQVRGLPSDQRSDIFAFGAILYEMLTAKRAFQGQTAADTLSAILQKDPPEMSQFVPDVSPALQRVIHRCLEKDPEQRFHSAHDLGFALESLSVSSATMAAARDVPRNYASLYRWMHGSITFLLACATVFLGIKFLRPAPSSQSLVQALITPPPNSSFQPFSEMGMALSPDGKIQAFVAITNGRKALWLRRLDETTATQLAGTEGAIYPFWSPDSRRIGFFADGKLKKIEITGTTPDIVCDAPQGRGGSWSHLGTILFAPKVNGLIYQVPSSGGEPKAVTTLMDKTGDDHRWPCLFPDGNHFLFSRNLIQELWLGNMDTGQSRLLMQNCSNATYVPPGYIVFSRNGILLAQAFDEKKNELQGAAFPILKEKILYYAPKTLAGFSVSSNGILSYMADETVPTQLTWVDRTGRKLSTMGEKGFYQSLRLSPDNKRISMIRVDPDVTSARDLWIYEIDRQSSTRFTFQKRYYYSPFWSADGQTIYYGSTSTVNSGDIFSKSSDGSGAEQIIFGDALFKRPTDISTDGKYLAYYAQDADSSSDIWILPLTAGAKPLPYLRTPFTEWDGQFSPDGKWIAYVSDESGRREIYVQSFPTGKGKWQISTAGGVYPLWARSGNELFFSTLDDVLTAVAITTSPSIAIGQSTALFQIPHGAPYAESDDIFSYEVSADGQRFLLNKPTESMRPSYITLALNWMAAQSKP